MIKYYYCNQGKYKRNIYKISDVGVYINIKDVTDFGIIGQSLKSLIEDGILSELTGDDLMIRDIIE